MIKLHFFVEICQLCALDLPLFEVSIKAFHEIICVKNGPTLPHSTEDISGTDRATDTIFFALKSEEYFPADKIAINCSSIVLLTPPDLPTKIEKKLGGLNRENKTWGVNKNLSEV